MSNSNRTYGERVKQYVTTLNNGEGIKGGYPGENIETALLCKDADSISKYNDKRHFDLNGFMQLCTESTLNCNEDGDSEVMLSAFSMLLSSGTQADTTDDTVHINNIEDEDIAQAGSFTNYSMRAFVNCISQLTLLSLSSALANTDAKLYVKDQPKDDRDVHYYADHLDTIIRKSMNK